MLAMIFGIVGIVLALCCAILGLGAAVTALVLGLVGLRKASDGLATNRGMALAGVICGGVGAVLAILNMILGFWLTSSGYGWF